jgi:hypothetical protein
MHFFVIIIILLAVWNLYAEIYIRMVLHQQSLITTFIYQFF